MDHALPPSLARPLGSARLSRSHVASAQTTTRKDYRRGFDWPLLIVSCLLAAVGVVAVHSATLKIGFEGGMTRYAMNQLVTALVGVVMMVGMALPDYRRFERWFPVFYLLNVGMLLAVQAIGISAKGSQRWIQFGSLRFQPSEFSKILLVLFLAGWLTVMIKGKLRLWHLLPPTILCLAPIYLVKKQPDLGTALSLVAIMGGMYLARGLSLKLVFGGGAAALMAMTLSFPIWFEKLEPHQKARIEAILNPEAHKKGAAYQQIQSKVAIGSGRLSGKGFGRGTQHRLHFLPEKHTDFIFAVLAEDWGLIGVTGVFALYLAFLGLSLRVALECANPFGILIVAGAIVMIFFQALVNLAMLVGWAPVTGIPLPFLSYGRTALLAMMAAAGAVMNVRLHS